MKQTRPEQAEPSKKRTAANTPTASRPIANPASQKTGNSNPRPIEEPLFNAKLIIPIAGAGLVLVAIIVLGIIFNQDKPADQRDQQLALGTALAATGYTPPPTPVPGSEFGVQFAILNLHNYIPILPGEKVAFYIVNTRFKSLYVSNCDGVILQRFTGTDPTKKEQTDDNNNWRSIAPGGFRFCGPATGRLAIQIQPGEKADASFKFDYNQTRPLPGEDWSIPGTYRLLITYYLTCPDSSLKASDCLDDHSSTSDMFKIVAAPAGYTPPPPAAQTAAAYQQQTATAVAGPPLTPAPQP